MKKYDIFNLYQSIWCIIFDEDLSPTNFYYEHRTPQTGYKSKPIETKYYILCFLCENDCLWICVLYGICGKWKEYFLVCKAISLQRICNALILLLSGSHYETIRKHNIIFWFPLAGVAYMKALKSESK